MALRVKVKRESRDAVMKRLRAVVPTIDVQLAAAQEKSAKQLAGAIKARAPVLTGEYRNSIQALKLSDVPSDKRALVGIGETKDPNAWAIVANYIWRFLEYGTRSSTIGEKITNKSGRTRTARRTHKGTRPFPHIFPTYREMRKSIRRRIASAVNKALKNVGHNGGPPLTG